MNNFRNMRFIILIVIFICFFEFAYSIRCYKCRGDEECDFKKRVIYVENCTWATKCWGARIGGYSIRSCGDDRCNLQIGLASYIETKCCYGDMCNDDNFFFPNVALSIKPNKIYLTFIPLLIFKFLNFL